jgi:hypothetical protein
MGWLKDIGNAISNAADSVADAVTNAVETVGNAVGGAVETGGNAIAGAIGAFGNSLSGIPVIGPLLGGAVKMLGRLVSGATQAITMGIRASFNILAHSLGGGIRIVGGAIGGVLAQDGKIFDKGFRGIAASLVGGVVATIGPVIGMVQSTFFLQSRERPLTEAEQAVLWRVYRGSIAYGAIRIVEGKAGLFSLSDRPFTMGNWIYAKGADLSTDLQTLVHECGHIWQNQHEGTIYLGNAIFAQMILKDDAYDWSLEHQAGLDWKDFNKEAQAAFIDEVFKTGTGAAATGPGAFYEDDPIGPAAHFELAGKDLTPFARLSIAYVRGT